MRTGLCLIAPGAIAVSWFGVTIAYVLLCYAAWVGVRVREIPDWISSDLLGLAVIGATARYVDALFRVILICLRLFCMECGDARRGRH